MKGNALNELSAMYEPTVQATKDPSDITLPGRWSDIDVCISVMGVLCIARVIIHQDIQYALSIPRR